MKTFTHFTLDGYVAQQTDFRTRLNQAFQADPNLEASFRTNIIAPLISGISAVGHTCTLSILGLADRVDTPGLTREQIRQQELSASKARAESAVFGIFEIMNEEFDGTLGSGWEDLPDVGVFDVGIGAAILAHDGPNLSEVQRRRNRRVDLEIVHYHP